MPGLGVEGELTGERPCALLLHPVHVPQDPVDGPAIDAQPGTAVDPWSPAAGAGDLDLLVAGEGPHDPGERLEVRCAVVVEPEVHVGVRAVGAAGPTPTEHDRADA